MNKYIFWQSCEPCRATTIALDILILSLLGHFAKPPFLTATRLKYWVDYQYIIAGYLLQLLLTRTNYYCSCRAACSFIIHAHTWAYYRNRWRWSRQYNHSCLIGSNALLNRI